MAARRHLFFSIALALLLLPLSSDGADIFVCAGPNGQMRMVADLSECRESESQHTIPDTLGLIADLQEEDRTLHERLDSFQWSGQLTVASRDTSFCDGSNDGTVWFDPSGTDGGMRICLSEAHIGKFSGGGILLSAGYIVFVTSGYGDADFGRGGGVGAADAICQIWGEAGSAAGPLGLTWRALVSDSFVAPRDRLDSMTQGRPIIRFGDPYVMVSRDAAGMWDQSIDRPINVDENGETITGIPYVWTGTTSSGDRYPGGTPSWHHRCQNWRYSGVASRTTYGNATRSDSRWISQGIQYCDREYRLYCISEEPIITEVHY